MKLCWYLLYLLGLDQQRKTTTHAVFGCGIYVDLAIENDRPTTTTHAAPDKLSCELKYPTLQLYMRWPAIRTPHPPSGSLIYLARVRFGRDGRRRSVGGWKRIGWGHLGLSLRRSSSRRHPRRLAVVVNFFFFFFVVVRGRPSPLNVANCQMSSSVGVSCRIKIYSVRLCVFSSLKSRDIGLLLYRLMLRRCWL